MDVNVNLSLALINITQAAIATSPNASGVALVGLSSSSFDVKQAGSGGSTYGWYEQTILGAPGVIQALTAVTLHPYQVRRVQCAPTSRVPSSHPPPLPSSLADATAVWLGRMRCGSRGCISPGATRRSSSPTRRRSPPAPLMEQQRVAPAPTLQSASCWRWRSSCGTRQPQQASPTTRQS